ncbi:hypothetical protein CK220_29850 [Mesorhizobium sp. WSM3860]|nr:hypothetical protein CK220_29850 [Mesorhizobium sp. WSM3860]
MLDAILTFVATLLVAVFAVHRENDCVTALRIAQPVRMIATVCQDALDPKAEGHKSDHARMDLGLLRCMSRPHL